jgi:hypothetical protein
MDSNALLIALFVFVTVMFLVLALTGGAEGKASTAARQRLEGFTRNQPELMQPITPSFSARVLTPMLRGAANGLGRLLPRSMLSGVEKSLVIAGEPMTLSGFLTMVLVASGSALVLGTLIVFVSGASFGPMQLGIIVVVALIGFFMPFYMIKSRARQR